MKVSTVIGYLVFSVLLLSCMRMHGKRQGHARDKASQTEVAYRAFGGEGKKTMMK
jgi:hypothetical protein